MRRLVLAIAAVLVLAAGGVAVAVWYFTSPTKGQPIPATRVGKAVIVIDLQEDYTGSHAKQAYAEPAKLVAAANRLIESAGASGWPVFLVRVEMPNDWWHGLMTGFTAIAGTPGAAFDARLARPSGAIELSKTHSDSFANPLLDRELAAKNVGHLYIAGIDAKYCVKQTVAGALNRGYTVNIVADAIATRHRTPIAELVEGYRASGAVIKSLAEATRELSPAPREPSTTAAAATSP